MKYETLLTVLTSSWSEGRLSLYLKVRERLVRYDERQLRKIRTLNILNEHLKEQLETLELAIARSDEVQDMIARINEIKAAGVSISREDGYLVAVYPDGNKTRHYGCDETRFLQFVSQFISSRKINIQITSECEEKKRGRQR
jgi:hypothetical protein